MADYSATSIAAEDVYATDDKPLLASESAIDLTNGVLKWTTDGDHSGTDQAATNWETSKATDGHLHTRTAPNANGTTWYLSWKCDATIDADILIVGPTNLGDVNLGVTLSLEIADNETFTTSLLEVQSSLVLDDKRIVFRDFDGTPNRYDGVKYARLKFVLGTSETPKVSQVFFGRRRQLKFGPERPWDGDRMRVDVTTFQSPGGVRTKYKRSTGGRELLPEFMLDSDDAATMDAFLKGTDYGAGKFWAIMQPNTRHTAAMLMDLDDEIIEEPYEGPFHKRASMTWTESPPYLSAEE